MSRGRIIWAIIAVVVVLVIVAAVFLSAQARVPQVTTAKVEKQNLTQTVTASGQTETSDEGQVFPPASGTLKQVFVIDGQEVKVGQALAMMDTKPLQLAVDQARAAYLQAIASGETIENSIPTNDAAVAADAGVTGAYSAYQAAKVNRDVAEANEASAAQALAKAKAAANSFPTSSTVQAAYGAAQAALRQAQGASASADAAVDQAYAAYRNAISGRTTVDVQSDQDEQLDAADAGVTSAATALLIAKDNLAHATLTAPIDGVVTFNAGATVAAAAAGVSGASAAGTKLTSGSPVSPASPPFIVTQLGALNFNAQVDEADVAHVRVGQKATVTLDAFPGEPFESKVVQVKTQAIQTSTGGTAFPVLVEIKGTGKRVLVGMGGNVDVEVSGIEDAVVVPVEALFDEGGSTYVYKVDGTVVHKTKVKTGVLTDTQAQILEGVQPGDTVALGNLSSLKDGMTVRVK